MTATVGEVAHTIIVTVNEASAAQVLVRPASVVIEAGGAIALGVEVLDRNGEPLEREVVWTSENESGATVTEAGLVTAVSPGTI